MNTTYLPNAFSLLRGLRFPMMLALLAALTFAPISGTPVASAQSRPSLQLVNVTVDSEGLANRQYWYFDPSGKYAQYYTNSVLARFEHIMPNFIPQAGGYVSLRVLAQSTSARVGTGIQVNGAVDFLGAVDEAGRRYTSGEGVNAVYVVAEVGETKWQNKYVYFAPRVTDSIGHIVTMKVGLTGGPTYYYHYRTVR